MRLHAIQLSQHFFINRPDSRVTFGDKKSVCRQITTTIKIKIFHLSIQLNTNRSNKHSKQLFFMFEIIDDNYLMLVILSEPMSSLFFIDILVCFLISRQIKMCQNLKIWNPLIEQAQLVLVYFDNKDFDWHEKQKYAQNE